MEKVRLVSRCWVRLVSLGTLKNCSGTNFLYFNSKGCKKLPKKVAPSKINHINAKKSGQIVLFRSKSASERPSSNTVVG